MYLMCTKARFIHLSRGMGTDNLLAFLARHAEGHRRPALTPRHTGAQLAPLLD